MPIDAFIPDPEILKPLRAYDATPPIVIETLEKAIVDSEWHGLNGFETKEEALKMANTLRQKAYKKSVSLNTRVLQQYGEWVIVFRVSLLHD